MKRFLIFCLLFFVSYFCHSQAVNRIYGDSIKFTNGTKQAQIIFETPTKTVSGGVLTNVGNGRVEFQVPSASGRGVDTIYRTPGKDSIQFTIGGDYYAIKDSIADISGKLDITDTTGHWVTSVYKRADSFFYFKNSIETFIGLDNAGVSSVTAVDTIYRTPGKDSIQFTIADRYHAIKDSIADISGKLNITDTTGHWVTSVYKRSDSLFYYKNGVETFIGIDSVGASNTDSLFGKQDNLLNTVRSFDFDNGNFLWKNVTTQTAIDSTTYLTALKKDSIRRIRADYFSQNTIQNGCVSGCTVTWISGYDYVVSASTYYIDGTLYSSPQTSLTLTGSDATLDRIDVFALTTSNTAVVVEGTLSATPEKPDVDYNTQLEISFVLVSALSTGPSIDSIVIYKENAGPPTEFTTAVTLNINAASTNFPYAGSKDVEFTNVVNGNNITYTISTSPDFTTVSDLTFKIKSKGNWGTNKKLVLQWFGGITPHGNPVSFGSNLYGFVSTNTTDYQNIDIPMADFGNITGATKLRMLVSNTSGNYGCYIDNVIMYSANAIGTGTGIQTILGVAPIRVTTTGNTATVSLNNSGVVAGTYNNVRVTVKGLVDSGYNTTYTTTAQDTTYRTPGKDSIQFTINGRYHAIKDSIGDVSGKLNISDTATMLNPYKNKVDSIYRTPGKDSIQFTINGRYHAIKDSSGAGGALSSTLTNAHIFVGNISNVATDVAMTGDVTITNAGVTSVGANKIVDAMIRQSAGLSVIGRSGNSTGNVADITGAANQVLRVSGTTLGFGTLDSAYLSTGFHTENYYNTKYLLSIGTFSNTSTANALDITGTVLTAHAADSTNPGGLSIGTQFIGYGTKLITKSSIGVTSANGLSIGNYAPATITLDQWSPSLIFHGAAWKQNSTAATRTFDWIIQGKNTTGASEITSTLSFDASNNGGAQFNAATLFTTTGLSASIWSCPSMVATTGVTTPTFPNNAVTTWSWGNSMKLFQYGGGTNVGGNLQLPGIDGLVADASYKVDAHGEVAATGGINIRSLSAPVFTLSTSGVAGTTTITYVVVAKLLNGQTVPSAPVTITTANATLTNTNFVQITATSNTSGAYQYLLYRTATNGTAPTTLGLVMTQFSMNSLQDKGIPADGTTVTAVNNTGNLGIGVTTTTAALHIRAGVAGVGGGAMKFNSGTLLTTPETGAVEWDGTDLYEDVSSTRYTLPKTLVGSATLDFPSTLATAVSDLTITVTGAADGDKVVLGTPNGSVTATATYTAWVSAANTVTVRYSPKATEDPASGTFKVSVIK